MAEPALADLAPADLVAIVSGRGPDAEGAWAMLVEQHVGLVWKVVRSFGLSKEASWDVYQSTWLRAIERLETLREANRFSAWLKTIARNEALAVIRARSKLVPSGDVPEGVSDQPATGDRLLRDEQQEAVRAGFAALSGPCQELLRLVTADPPVPYEEIERRLGMKHGSIGPSRGRCLEKLRSTPAMITFLRGDDASRGQT